MGRFPNETNSGLKKGPWTPEEDKKLVDHITKNGHGCWRSLPKLAGLNRCGKSCRLRWTNYLRPDIKRGKFSEEEERIIINLHSALGNKWSQIANSLPGRTDNEIKNYWNTYLRKKLLQMGIDPNTHKPRADLNQLLSLSNLLNSSSHLTSLIMNNSTTASFTQNWDNINALKLQAQTTDQLVKIQLLQNLFQVLNTTSTNSYIDHMNNNASTSASTSMVNILLGAQNLNQITKHSQIQSLGFVGPASYDSPNIDHPSTLACIEGSKSKEMIIQHEDVINPLPGLVSEPYFTTTGNIFSNQVEKFDEPNNNNSTTFEDWERFMDNDGETSESYWKDILELMSDSPTP